MPTFEEQIQTRLLAASDLTALVPAAQIYYGKAIDDAPRRPYLVWSLSGALEEVHTLSIAEPVVVQEILSVQVYTRRSATVDGQQLARDIMIEVREAMRGWRDDNVGLLLCDTDQFGECGQHVPQEERLDWAREGNLILWYKNQT